MEHSVTLHTKDGTEYRLTYDNETSDGTQMHYLLHEDGVLKLECSHHALPVDLTEEEFKSSVVPIAFLNCLGRTLSDLRTKEEALNSGDGMLAELATLIRPHVALEPDQIEYVTTIADRGHSVELFVQLERELQVERFARQLNTEVADGEYALPNELAGRYLAEGRPVGVRQFFATYYPAIAFAVAVVLLVGGYMLLVG